MLRTLSCLLLLLTSPALTAPLELPIDGASPAVARCASTLQREKVRFSSTGSICMEGASAHIAGRGCSTIRWKRQGSGAYHFHCETRDTCDITHTGTFIAVPMGQPPEPDVAAAEVWCVDKHYTLFYRPGPG